MQRYLFVVTGGALSALMMAGVMFASVAGAQQPAPQAAGAGAVRKAPCPDTAKQSAALKDSQTPGPTNPDAAQAAEKSGILPSAPGDTPSAAATVQQDGEAVASPMDCALAPGHPNELKK